jgi:hypothetical protein
MADNPRDVPIYVAKENIERFQKLLAVAGLADAERARLLAFLVEQETRLSAAQGPEDFSREALA